MARKQFENKALKSGRRPAAGARGENTLFAKDKKKAAYAPGAKGRYQAESKNKAEGKYKGEGKYRGEGKYKTEANYRREAKAKYAKKEAGPYNQDIQEAASLDYIYGVNAVKEAFDGNRTINNILVEIGKHSPSVHEIIVKAKERRIVIKEVAKEKLKSLVGTDRHQGVVAYMSPIQYYDVEKIKLDQENADVVIALDEITDVNNLGAILRTVEACGLRYVMIPERRSCQLNSSVSKTSVGAIEYVRTVRVSSLSKALNELKEAGYWIIGTDGSATQDFKNVDYSGKVVIVIGSEGKGMRQNIRALCDFIVSIPMYGRINSLNASVSASLLLYEAIRNKK